ncbi:hypothetical protein ACFYSC_34930 [Streptosporangium sp. NPDC004379]|uniref:hypothetical protein n=1 Tax=Streptosporangium sp. NPDC004379 TaxID=3366189 RepID=UPI0036CCFFC7
MEQQTRFIHLVRLGWDLRVLGVRTSLVLPVAGNPVLEVHAAAGVLARITAVRRRRGWVFTWRPWWTRLWRRDEWVWAEADNAADIVRAEVTGVAGVAA